MDRRQAWRFLASLREGESVTVTTSEGRSWDMTVMQEYAVGQQFGSWDHKTAKLGFGWGRYAVDVSPVSIEDSRYTVERREVV